MVTIISTISSTNLQDKIILLTGQQQRIMYYDFSHLCFLLFLYIYERIYKYDIISMVANFFLCLLFEEQCVLYVCICFSKEIHLMRIDQKQIALDTRQNQ